MESTWVRSVYLYVVCAVAVVLVAGGAVMGVVATTNLIAPELGHRDNIDRVGVGLANVAQDVVDIVRGNNGQNMQDAQDYCKEWASEDEYDQCVAEMSGGNATQMISDGISSMKDEIHRQIRDTAIAKLIRGLLLIVVGWLLWRFHARRTELYRDGLRPRAVAGAAPAVPSSSLPVPGAVPAPLQPPMPTAEPPATE